MKVSVGVSARHVHLSDADYKILFGDNLLTIKTPLKQPNMFASNSFVTIKGSKGEITNVRVLGPNRDYTQVEVSKTDCYLLGINPPVRNSGELDKAGIVTIVGPLGSIKRESAIIAARHIHVDQNIIQEKHLENIKMVQVRIKSSRGGIMDNVYLKKSQKAFFEMHIDLDDANAFLLKSGDEVEIIQ